MSENIVQDAICVTDLQEGAQVPVLLTKTAAVYPELMTKEELIDYLRIPQVSMAKNLSNAVENLRRMHGLPYIYMCGKPLYPKKAIQKWIEVKTEGGL